MDLDDFIGSGDEQLSTGKVASIFAFLPRAGDVKILNRKKRNSLLVGWHDPFTLSQTTCVAVIHSFVSLHMK